MKKAWFHILLAASVAVFMSACSKTEYETAPLRRVVLMYSAAYNNLSASIAEDVQDLCNGDLPAAGSGDVLLVYTHNTAKAGDYVTPTNPVLIRAFRGLDGTPRQDTLIVYPETDISGSPETLNKVLKDVKEIFPAKDYGLIFSSHAKGWLPPGYKETEYTIFGASRPDYSMYPATKELGIENVTGSGIDIRDLADAIPMKLDFFMMDACLMGCVEVAYELREKCRMIIFSPTEILSDGFDYKIMAPKLANISSPDLKGICTDYFDYYNAQSGYYRSATVTLVDCSKLDALAEVCKEIISAHRESISAIKRDKLQAYFYNNLHWFFDLRDMLEKGGASIAELGRFEAALNDCVPYMAATEKFFDLALTNVCGLSVYFPIPEQTELNNYYKTLSWNKATGLIQ